MSRRWPWRWSQRWPWLVLTGLLVMYFVFGVLFAYHTKKFNAPDERMHFYNLQTVARTGQMPLFTDEKVAKEAHQPPLYYWVMTPAYWASYYLAGDLNNDLTDGLKDNMGNNAANETTNETKNQTRKKTGDNVGNNAATKQQVFWLRVGTLIMSSGVIVLAYVLVCQVFPRQQFSVQPWLALTAAGIVALNPQFIFMSGVINNDSIANLMSATLLSLLVWLLLHRGNDNRDNNWTDDQSKDQRKQLFMSGVVGLLLAGGALSKPHVWPVVALVAVVFGVTTWRRHSGMHSRMRNILIGLVPVMVVMAWWFGRNTVLYGAPTIYALMYDQWYAEQHREFLSVIGLRTWVVTLFETFWARFGYFDLALSRGYYFVAKVFTGLAVVGGVTWLWRSWKLFTTSERWVWLTTSLGVLGVWLIVFGFNLSFYQPQGRYLFPVITVLAMYYAVGLIALVPRKMAPKMVPLMCVVLVGLLLWMDWASLQIIAQ